MAEPAPPRVYSIAAHRGFADALVAGLVPRYREEHFGLARLTLLLPSQRAARTVTEAFVRHSGAGDRGGLLLPRMAVVGDLDLDETLGALLDPLGAGAEIPPAADPLRRWLRLADILRAVQGERAARGAALLRQALMLGQTMDRLLAEGIAPADLLADRVLALFEDQAEHWKDATRDFAQVQQYWLAELDALGQVDAPSRRNLLFERAARAWRETPPAHPVVAAGVTSASPALARLLRVVSELPRGSVILPDLDLSLDDAVWDELGLAGQPLEAGGEPFGREDAVTHPQYHLKVLLNRMGVARGEVRPWHRAGMAAAEPARSRAISSLFLPPRACAGWVDLPAARRRLAGVRLMETAHPGEEAQAIAVLIREALEVPERRVALITPDRALAGRVAAHLLRWGIAVDDTAGRPLGQTPAGRLVLLLAEVMAEACAPVPLVALLGHPRVAPGEGRAEWLDHVRALDRALRGPRPDAGLAALEAVVADCRSEGLASWWAGVAAVLAPLFDGAPDIALADGLDRLATAAEALCGEAIWSGPDGRALSAFVEDLRSAAREIGTVLPVRDLPAALRDAMDRVAVRPPWGGHPRVSLYGLLEARMARADLVICGGLVEGTWPATPAPDPVLPPAILRALGVPGADFRIGLAAHDLAAALGAPEVVLSHAARDESGPAIPSRFVLRVRAMLGEQPLLDEHGETRAVMLARALASAPRAAAHPRPQPDPAPEQRRVAISVTALDRLRSDPYQFYASAILGLGALNDLDAEPDARQRGDAVHAILDRWHREGSPPERLLAIADEELDKLSAHPLMRGLWRPRLVKALESVGAAILAAQAQGREVAITEARGDLDVDGVRLHGRVDRVDRLADGTLAIVDYKTGAPPTNAEVEKGFALQLGLLGLIARGTGFRDNDGRFVAGEPVRFEYWSMAKNKDDGFGYVQEPFKEGRKTKGAVREHFLDTTADYLKEAIDRWIKGREPFTARLNPDIGGYNDFDQLMRLDEWQGQIDQREREQGDQGA
ncbi:MAG TPA: double-strand break repair protein AddB [Novosphingobium sp.]|nr:double-strand break repair protein AddB [Novosphingobium sp.]